MKRLEAIWSNKFHQIIWERRRSSYPRNKMEKSLTKSNDRCLFSKSNKGIIREGGALTTWDPIIQTLWSEITLASRPLSPCLHLDWICLGQKGVIPNLQRGMRITNLKRGIYLLLQMQIRPWVSHSCSNWLKFTESSRILKMKRSKSKRKTLFKGKMNLPWNSMKYFLTLHKCFQDAGAPGRMI